MGKVLKLPLAVKVHGTEWAMTTVTIDVSTGGVAEWCAGLCLIDSGLVDALTIIDAATESFRLRIARQPLAKRRWRKTLVGPGSVTWQEGGADVLIPAPQFGYLLHFSLRCFRDEVGEVPQIDQEIPPHESNTGRGLHLVLKVPVSQAPAMSLEEVRHMLGLPPAQQ